MSSDQSLADRAAGFVRPADAQLREQLAPHWDRYYWLVAALLALGGVAAMGVPFLARHGFGPPWPHNDSVILEYVGWYVADGHTLYTDIWEIKPPLAFLPSYLAGILAGENMFLHHLLGIATTTVGLAVTVAASARVVGSVTDSPTAGVAAAIAFFALPELFYLPWLGYKAKILVVALGVVALERALHERFLASGLLAGLAVGVWQLGVIFPVVTLAAAARSREPEAVRSHLVGSGIAALCILGALLLYADLGGFVAEVLLGPLVLRTETAGFNPVAYLRLFPVGLGVVVTGAGVLGLAAASVDPDRTRARPIALGGVLVVGLLLVDFDGYWDAVTPLVFAAFGVGLLVAYLPRRGRVAAVLVLALAVTATFAPSPMLRQDPVAMEPTDGKPPALDPEREHLYWNAEEVESCRFFGAGTQRSILQYYPDADRLAEAPCGNAGLAVDVAVGRLVPGVSPPTADATPDADPDATPEAGANESEQPLQPVDHPVRVRDGFGYAVANGSVVARVPLENRAPRPRSADVAIVLEQDGETVTHCASVTLGPGEDRTLRHRFEVSWESAAMTVDVDNHC